MEELTTRDPGLTPVTISNADFFKAIFDVAERPELGSPWVLSFKGDPLTIEKGKWHGWPVINRSDISKVLNLNNNFFVVSTFIEAPYQDKNGVEKIGIKRRKSHWKAMFLVMIDDVGTKVPFEKLVLPASYLIETSPDNYQAGYLLDVPCTDIDAASGILDALVAAGLSIDGADPGMKGVTRYGRPPVGVNGKQKYVDILGGPFTQVLWLWEPTRRYSIETLWTAFNLKPVEDKTKGSTSKHNNSGGANDANEVLNALKNRGMVKGPGGAAGSWDITCPWCDEHTGQVDDGASYIEPCKDYPMGGFKCFHGHCSERTLKDLINFLGLAKQGKIKEPTQAEQLLDISSDLVLFHDQYREPHVFLAGECIRLKDKKIRQHLSYRMYQTTGKAPNSDAIAQALAVMEGKAIFEGEQRNLENRVAKYKSGFLFDLGDHRSVFIQQGTWDVINSPPIFRRYTHQQIQIDPLRGGDPWALFDYLNVAEEHRLLILVTFISYLVPEIPHPIFHPWGPQGSGKTSVGKAAKLLVDPSSVLTLAASHDRSVLIHNLFKHYLPVFDNVSGISGEVSDLLCQACTGGGIEKRQLYTDDESVIYDIRRCVGLNGVNLAFAKPDLLDRTLLLHMERIQPDKRREEGELWESFGRAKAGVLGGMFSTLADAMGVYPSVKLDELPRLADFARWGVAIATALDTTGKGLAKQFTADYSANVRRQSEEVVAGNTLCSVLLGYMANRDIWETTVGEAFTTLREKANPDRYDRTFPSAEKELRKHLMRINTTLIDHGISYTIADRGPGGYPIAFRKGNNFASFASSGTSGTGFSAANEPNEPNEANFSTSGNSDNDDPFPDFDF